IDLAFSGIVVDIHPQRRLPQVAALATGDEKTQVVRNPGLVLAAREDLHFLAAADTERLLVICLVAGPTPQSAADCNALVDGVALFVLTPRDHFRSQEVSVAIVGDDGWGAVL